MKDKSVLTFYYAENACNGEFDFTDVWDRICSKVAKNIRCINVHHCEISEIQLSDYVRNLDCDSQLMLAISSEFENGAIFMFVAPEIGRPIDGFLLEEFLACN